MKYITGIHALNLCCQLDTPGDWHQSGIQWVTPVIRESQYSIFQNYGIEPNHKIPEHTDVFYVANHIRALLDLLDEGNFLVAQGMRNDFICNSKYDYEIFSKVLLLKNNINWPQIDKFMEKEYKLKWLKFKEVIIHAT